MGTRFNRQDPHTVLPQLEKLIDQNKEDLNDLREEVKKIVQEGATSYDVLTDKPQIEGVTLEGNKTYSQLNLNRLTNLEIESLLT